ncbi:MAG: sigma-70 family RNA polymerase sigma factor [Akkermansiaceae bacterium]|nr:sigma-70 family RNA polymerase sigma factor [Akkermansiaceae bacterium]
MFEAEESPLLRYAFGLVGRREVAEELVQDAFLRLHQHWEEVRQPRAWLFRCVRNRAYNYLRDHRRETLTDPALPDGHPMAGPDDKTELGREAPDDVLGKMEASGLVHMFVGELDERDQLLVRLKYFEGLKYSQISQRTGMSVGNVGYRLHHILKDLADSLRRAGVEGAKG